MRSSMTIGRRGAQWMLALAAVVAGAVVLIVAIRAQVSAPKPPHAVGRINPQVSPTVTPTTPGRAAHTRPGPLGPSQPVSLSIPAIGVRTPVFPIGLAADGTLAVPQPGPHLNHAAWFKNSPTPGQPGPSVIEGHVDSVQGVSVFFKLGAIRPGNRVLVSRADGTKLVFTVDGVRDYLKSRFPTNLVYGASRVGVPELRLITCSDFNTSIHHHLGNEVVFAHLTKVSGRPRA